MSKTRHRPKTDFPRRLFERMVDKFPGAKNNREKLKRLRKGKR